MLIEIIQGPGDLGPLSSCLLLWPVTNPRRTTEKNENPLNENCLKS